VGEHSLPRRARLTRAGDIQALFRGGVRVERPCLLLLWRRGAGARRAAFTVSRQVEGAASRNRARRRVREAYRLSSGQVPPGVELVLVARPRAEHAPFPEILADLRAALGAVGRRLREGVP
jgi:ribonuclease P protein component